MGQAVPFIDREGVVHTRENGNEMALKSLDGAFGIDALVNIRRGELDGATIAADGGFELARCLIVKDVTVDMNDLGVLPLCDVCSGRL